MNMHSLVRLGTRAGCFMSAEPDQNLSFFRVKGLGAARYLLGAGVVFHAPGWLFQRLSVKDQGASIVLARWLRYCTAQNQQAVGILSRTQLERDAQLTCGRSGQPFHLGRYDLR